jgi:hypothetical protein
MVSSDNENVTAEPLNRGTTRAIVTREAVPAPEELVYGIENALLSLEYDSSFSILHS